MESREDAKSTLWVGGGGNEQVEFLEEISHQDWVSHLCQQNPIQEPGLAELD